MKQRTAILLALGLTVFVVVIAGAIALSIQAQTVAKAVNAEAIEAPVQGVQDVSARVGLDATAVPTWTSIPAATSKPTQLPAVTNLALTSGVPVTPDRAARIALALKPGAKARRLPELVNYRGKMAYEVSLTTAWIYVDAFTGNVLAQVAVVVPSPTPTEFVPTPEVSADNGGGGDSGGGGGGPSDNPGPTDVPTRTPRQPTPEPKPKHHKEKEKHDDDGHDDHSEIFFVQ